MIGQANERVNGKFISDILRMVPGQSEHIEMTHSFTFGRNPEQYRDMMKSHPVMVAVKETLLKPATTSSMPEEPEPTTFSADVHLHYDRIRVSLDKLYRDLFFEYLRCSGFKHVRSGDPSYGRKLKSPYARFSDFQSHSEKIIVLYGVRPGQMELPYSQIETNNPSISLCALLEHFFYQHSIHDFTNLSRVELAWDFTSDDPDLIKFYLNSITSLKYRRGEGDEFLNTTYLTGRSARVGLKVYRKKIDNRPLIRLEATFDREWLQDKKRNILFLSDLHRYPFRPNEIISFYKGLDFVRLYNYVAKDIRAKHRAYSIGTASFNKIRKDDPHLLSQYLVVRSIFHRALDSPVLSYQIDNLKQGGIPYHRFMIPLYNEENMN
ncbi:MAG: hypothetical protein ACLQVJ_12370 [Syntrophobacteraceae bacterium]